MGSSAILPGKIPRTKAKVEEDLETLTSRMVRVCEKVTIAFWGLSRGAEEAQSVLNELNDEAEKILCTIDPGRTRRYIEAMKKEADKRHDV